MLADLRRTYTAVRATLDRARDTRDPEHVSGLLNDLTRHVAKMGQQLTDIDAIDVLDDGATLGARLRGLRGLTGASQTIVAEAVGISQSALSKLEHDTGKRDLDVILALAEYYGVPATYLLRAAQKNDAGRML